MPDFKYRARDRQGKAVSGLMSGAGKEAVAAQLNGMGYVPVSIEEARYSGFELPAFLDIFIKRVRLQEVNMFTRQLLTLQRAGIPLMTSLGVLEKQVSSRYFKDVIKGMMASVESGSSLSEAMMKYRKVFNELYVNMVKAGEVSGLLDEVLERLAEFGERELDNRTKIKTATRYPLITLVALFFAFVIVVTFVIPKFANIFSQFKANLPLPTKILLATSTFMQRFWYIVVLVVVALAFLFLRYVNTKRGRPQWDYVKLRIPLFGPIISMLVMSRFARTMSILIRSGLPILQVLDMVSRTVGNAAVSRTVDEIAANVREGKSISAPMGLSKLFPPIVVQMVAVGEDTGKIDELLMKVSEYYDQQSDYSMKNLSTMIEPVFVLILGVMVLIMALAIFLPMWNLASVVIKH